MKIEINPSLLHAYTDWDAAIRRLGASHEEALHVLRKAKEGNLLQVAAAWQIFMTRPELQFGAPDARED